MDSSEWGNWSVVVDCIDVAITGDSLGQRKNNQTHPYCCPFIEETFKCLLNFWKYNNTLIPAFNRKLHLPSANTKMSKRTHIEYSDMSRRSEFLPYLTKQHPRGTQREK